MTAEIEIPTLAGLLTSDKKVLICWFSKTGNTKRVVDVLKRKIQNCQEFEIDADQSYKGFVGWMRTFWSTMRRGSQKVEKQLPDFKEFDAILLGTPVWAWKLPAPVLEFLRACDFAGKPVIPIAVAASNTGDGFWPDVRKHVVNGTVVESAPFYGIGSMKDPALEARVDEFLNGM
jgi:flavodoxin